MKRTLFMLALAGLGAVATVSPSEGAENTAISSKINDSKNYILNESLTYDLSSFEWPTKKVEGVEQKDPDKGKIYLENGKSVGLYTDADVTANLLTTKGNASYEKLGTGVLEFTQWNTDSGYNDVAKNVTVSAGTLKISYGGGDNGKNGFASGNVTVAAGATLQLTGSNALGWHNNYDGGGGDQVDTLTLGAGASLLVDAHQMLTTNIDLNGASIGGTEGSLKFLGGTIKATGTSTITTALKANWDINLNVVGTEDKLTVSGAISKDGGSKLVKTGAGTLVLENAFSNLADGIELYVQGGIMDLGHGGGETLSNLISVTNGATLKATEYTLSNLSLNNGGLIIQNQNSLLGAITLAGGDNTVSATTYSALRASVSTSGETVANLTLDGSTTEGKGLILASSVNNAGTVTIKNKVATESTASIGAKVTSVDVMDGAILDLSAVSTLGAQAMQLDAAATLVLGTKFGENAIAFAGALTLNADLDGVSTLAAEPSATTIKLTGSSSETFTDGTVLFKGLSSLSGDVAQVTLDFGNNDTALYYLSVNNGNLVATVEAPVVSVPEPATATLSLLALAGLAARRRRK